MLELKVQKAIDAKEKVDEQNQIVSDSERKDVLEKVQEESEEYSVSEPDQQQVEEPQQSVVEISQLEISEPDELDKGLNEKVEQLPIVIVEQANSISTAYEENKKPQRHNSGTTISTAYEDKKNPERNDSGTLGLLDLDNLKAQYGISDSDDSQEGEELEQTKSAAAMNIKLVSSALTAYDNLSKKEIDDLINEIEIEESEPTKSYTNHTAKSSKPQKRGG